MKSNQLLKLFYTISSQNTEATQSWTLSLTSIRGIWSLFEGFSLLIRSLFFNPILSAQLYNVELKEDTNVVLNEEMQVELDTVLLMSVVIECTW